MCDLYNKKGIIYSNSFKYTTKNIPKSFSEFVNSESNKQTELYIKNPFNEIINIKPLWPNHSIHENLSSYAKSLLPNEEYNLKKKNSKICKFRGTDTSFYMYANTDYPNMSVSSDGYCLTSGYNLS